MSLKAVDKPAKDEGREVSFPMRHDAEHVRCTVQQGALDSVESSFTGDAGDRMARFDRHRAMFEAVASDLYDAGLPPRITADHVRMLHRAMDFGRRSKP